MVDALNRVGGAPVPEQSAPKRRVVQEEAVPKPKDTVEISDSAKAAKEVQTLVQFVKGTPEVRADMVKAAREDLAKGTLLTDETTDKLAKKVAELFG